LSANPVLRAGSRDRVPGEPARSFRDRMLGKALVYGDHLAIRLAHNHRYCADNTILRRRPAVQHEMHRGDIGLFRHQRFGQVASRPVGFRRVERQKGWIL
jgi:hypothetical protein